MAMFVFIRKVMENDHYADYTFGESDDSLGNLRFDKITGEATLLEAALGDDNFHRYNRAALKLAKCWQTGSLPDETCWAS